MLMCEKTTQLLLYLDFPKIFMFKNMFKQIHKQKKTAFNGTSKFYHSFYRYIS